MGIYVVWLIYIVMQVGIVGAKLGPLLPFFRVIGQAIAGDFLIFRMFLLIDGNLFTHIGRHVFKLFNLVVA